jgi:hypothetical protein
MSIADAEFAWPIVAPLLQTAIDQTEGEFDLEFVRGRIQLGFMKLWALHEGKLVIAVAVTEIVKSPEYKWLRVVLLAGKDMQEWIHLEPLLEHFARREECAFIEAYARPGLAKVLKAQGYHTAYHVIRRPVEVRMQ